MILFMVGTMLFAGGSGEAASTPVLDLEDVELDGVEVLFWHQHSRSREELMNSIIADFNSSNPYGITVVGEYAGGYGDIYNKMISGIAAGVVPDLVVAYQNQAGSYMLADGLVDIEPYVDDPVYGLTEADKADFIEGIYNSDYNAQFDNKRLGFPPNRSMEVLYYNMDWLRDLGFSAPPKNWNEFAEMARAATDAAGGTYGFPISTGASTLFAMTISRGGDGYLDADKANYEFNTPEIRDSISAIKQLYDEGVAKKIAEQYGEQTDFANRLTPFAMGSTSGLPYYRSAIESSEQGVFEWSVAPIPYTTARPAMDMYGASVSIPSTTPEKQLAAWLFLKHLTTTDAQKSWSEASGYFPVRASVREKLEGYISENSQYGDAFDILLNSDIVTEPPIASYDEVRRIVSSYYNEILDGADLNDALDELTEEANFINVDMMP